MPIQLNEEQTEAKKLLLNCIRERDYDNAFAMLENFPGFTVTPEGPQPIGSAFLRMVNPKVTKPRVYVIALMQLLPEFKDMLPEADAFVADVQQRIMRDQEAYLAEQARRAKRDGGGGPAPTAAYEKGGDD